nr:phosphoenolpyruvate kinase [Ferruginibacter sp.]
MNLTISEQDKDALLGTLQVANLKFQKTYPGDKPDRQPVHTVYGGANLFKSDTTLKMGDVALRSLKNYAPNFCILAKVLKLENHEHFPTIQTDIEALTKKLDAMTEDQRKSEPAW